MDVISHTYIRGPKGHLDRGGEIVIRKFDLSWVGFAGDELFVWNGFRLNGGGYMYGANPYRYWRIGPIFVKRYLS
jgi:hypothetical protein